MYYMFQDLDGKRSGIQVYKITCGEGRWMGGKGKEGKERRKEGGGRREESVGISWSLSLPYMKVSNNSNHYEISHSTHRRP